MSEQAAALLRKYHIQHGALELLGGGTNTSWRALDTPYVVRVAAESVDNGLLQVGLRAATVFQAAGVRFVNPAFPFVIQTADAHGAEVRGTLWFYEQATGEPTDYRQLGEVVRELQEVGSASMEGASVSLPDALSVSELQRELDDLFEQQFIDAATYELLDAWLPRIERGAAKLGPAKQVLVHDDLWAKNTIMTEERGLVLCDPDNLAWGRPEYDLAFISRGREAGRISREEVRAFEEGYKGRIPDLNTAWRMALFHRFRWVCHMIERQGESSELDQRLAGELALWRTKRGPQPG